MSRKKSKRIVPILQYSVRSFKEYEIIADLPGTKELVFSNLVAAISESIETKKKAADIFLVDYDNYISLKRNSWENSLNKAIEYYSSIEVEDYEMCQKCINLINKINTNVVVK